jgi:hypothetical protein
VVASQTGEEAGVTAPAAFGYDGRLFRSVANTPNGEVNADTLFEYHQSDDLVWATYHGGEIRFGTLVGTVESDGALTFHYTHLNTAGVQMAGHCRSIPTSLQDGRVRLDETWRWLTGDRSSGSSAIEEVQA